MNNGPWFQPNHPDRRLRVQVWNGEKYSPAFSDAQLDEIDKAVSDQMVYGFGAVEITESGEIKRAALQ